jgi:hypothetical protein
MDARLRCLNIRDLRPKARAIPEDDYGIANA